MYETTVEYTNFFGNPSKKVLYFHLSESKMVELKEIFSDDMSEKIRQLDAEKDIMKIMHFFDLLLKASYGKPSEDGDRFIQDEELWKEFSESAAYYPFIQKINSVEGEMMRFIRGILPQDLGEKSIEEYEKQTGRKLPEGARVPQDYKKTAPTQTPNKNEGQTIDIQPSEPFNINDMTTEHLRELLAKREGMQNGLQ